MANNTTLPDPVPSVPAAPPAGAIESWLADPLHVIWLRLGGTLLIFLAIWIMVWLFDRAATRSAMRVARLRRMDDQKTKAMVGRTKPARMTVRLVLVALGAIAVVGMWGLETAFTGLLAGAGFAGIVIGLAAGDTIGDIIAGFLIFYNHPFDIGDWVQLDGIEGIVEDVALGATTIMTFDNEKVTIPNRVVEGGQVKNLSHARKLRRRLLVGVEYGSHLGLAMKTLVDLAKAHPDVFVDPEPSAVTKGFGASSVDLELRYYVEPVRTSVIKVYTDLIHQTHDTFKELGIKIAFPHVQIVQGKAWEMADSSDPSEA